MDQLAAEDQRQGRLVRYAAHHSVRRADFNGASNFCMNWSRNVTDDLTYVGYLRKRDKQFAWTRAAFLACTGTGLLYCFQQ